MGIKVAQDLIEANHINQEQKLWRHVILNAFEDARLKTTDRKSSINKLEAQIGASTKFWADHILNGESIMFYIIN